jgi:hypothetical protein
MWWILVLDAGIEAVNFGSKRTKHDRHIGTYGKIITSLNGYPWTSGLLKI